MEFFSCNFWYYNFIICEFSCYGNFWSCFKVLDFMKELGVMFDVFIYCVLIDLCGCYKELFKVIIVFEVFFFIFGIL